MNNSGSSVAKGDRSRCHGYRVVGDLHDGTTPVFLMSGAFQGMRSWKRLEHPLRRSATIVTVDLPGMACADPLARPHGVDFLVETIRALLDQLRIESVHVVAASSAVAAAYRFAQLHPGRVDSLVLAGGLAGVPDHRRRAVERAVDLLERARMAEFAKQIMDALLCRDPDRHVANRHQVERILYRTLTSIDGEHRRNFVLNTRRLLVGPQVDPGPVPDVRALVVTGEHDRFTTPEACRDVAAAFDSAVFATIRHADHLFHLERFDTTAELIDRWVRALPLGGVRGVRRLEHLDPGPLPAPGLR